MTGQDDYNAADHINARGAEAYRALSREDQLKVDTLILESNEELARSMASRLTVSDARDNTRSFARQLDDTQQIDVLRSLFVAGIGADQAGRANFTVNDVRAALRDVVADPRVIDGIQASDVRVENIARNAGSRRP